MKKRTDNEIIELYWNRDESAIRETETKYGNYCFAVANNILDSREDAEECLSDTWLTAWNTIPPKRPKVLKLSIPLAYDREEVTERKKKAIREILKRQHHFVRLTSRLQVP